MIKEKDISRAIKALERIADELEYANKTSYEKMNENKNE
mgnify:CR=1 FL=1